MFEQLNHSEQHLSVELPSSAYTAVQKPSITLQHSVNYVCLRSVVVLAKLVRQKAHVRVLRLVRSE